MVEQTKQCPYTSTWALQREIWKTAVVKDRQEKEEELEVVEGEPFLDLPVENETAMEGIKQTLRSTRRPYPRFDGYYKLEEVIEQYMHVWFEDTTSSD